MTEPRLLQNFSGGRAIVASDRASSVDVLTTTLDRLGVATDPADIVSSVAAIDLATLQPDRRRLTGPGGASVVLSDIDRRIMACFAEAHGAVVTREQLQRVLAGRPGVDLNACVYRLRHRVAVTVGAPLPVRAKSGRGYVFRGRIDLA